MHKLILLMLFFSPLLAKAENRDCVFLLHWNHQAQFAGYYVAAEKGFYRKRGRDLLVSCCENGMDQALLQTGTNPVFFTTMLFTAMVYRDQGLQIVHLAQIVNRPNFCLVAWKKRGILRPEDLQGRKVSFWRGAFEAPYNEFFKRYGLKPQTEPQYYSVNLFLRGGVDACAAMYYNEYHLLLQCGVDPEDLTVFKTWEHGFDCPEDGIYCTIQTASDPQLCRDIVAASLEGWQYARDHRQEALDIVMDHVRRGHVPASRSHMKWMLDKVLDSVFPDSGDSWRFGSLARERYESAGAMLRAQGLIKSTPKFEDFHFASFLSNATAVSNQVSFSNSCAFTEAGENVQ